MNDNKKAAIKQRGVKKRMNIFDYLPVGEANAIPKEELTKLCGFKSSRELQEHIEILRNSGHVIVSKCYRGGGYYIHQDKRELKAFIKTFENRATHTLRSIESAKQTLKEMEERE